MKNIVFISSVFYPSGSVATERVRLLIKHLPDKYNLSVLCLSELEIRNLRGTGESDKHSYTTILDKINLFNTKSNRMFRIIYMVMFLLRLPDRYIKFSLALPYDYKPDLIIATGPVFTNFILAYVEAIRFKVPFIIDYRDPWSMNDDYYTKYSLIKLINLLLEKVIIVKATKVVVTSNRMKSEMIKQRYCNSDKIEVIMNGYQ